MRELDRADKPVRHSSVGAMAGADRRNFAKLGHIAGCMSNNLT